MKLYLRHICFVLLTLMVCQAARAGTETATRRYDVSQLELKAETAPDGKTFTRVNWEGLELTSTPGAPELPVEYIRFIVPTFVKVTGVNVRSKLLLSQKLDYSIYPAQEPVSTNHEGPVEFTVPDPQAYNTTYPIRAEYVEDGFIDGCNHIVTVAVYPFFYNPVDNTYSGVSSLTVMLDYEECGMAQLNATPIFPPHQSKYLDLTSMVENPDRLSSPAYVPRRKATADTPEYYYIITPRALADAFEDLAVWKRQKGYNVVVKCIEDVYEDDDFRIGNKFRLNADAPEEVVLDSAMSLRCYLKREFQDHGHFFCLLAGDWRTPMPIRKATSGDVGKLIYETDENGHAIKDEQGHLIIKDTIYVTDNNEYATPTDSYFSNLSKKFALTQRQKMSLYSVVTGDLNLNYDITIGRLLCCTRQEISNYLHKLFLYEANPGYGDNQYLSNALFIECCNLNGNNNPPLHEGCIIHASEDIRKNCDLFDNVLLLQDSYHTCLTGEELDPNAIVPKVENGPSAPEAITYLEKCGFSSWQVHGTPYGISVGADGHIIYADESLIGCAPYGGNQYKNYNGSGINNMRNFSKPSFVYSTACQNAPFDALTENEGKENSLKYTQKNIGQRFATGGLWGGVGAIMNTRNGYRPESTKLELEFINTIKKHPKVGVSLANSKLTAPIWGKAMYLKVHLIGEPEFEMWLGRPKDMKLTLKPSSAGYEIVGTPTDSISLFCSNGNSAKLMSQNTHAGTSANPFSTGEYTVSLWKSGYLPLITLFAQNGVLKEYKRYVVRNAVLGSGFDNLGAPSYSVGENGRLSIRAIDNVETRKGFFVKNGGAVDISCDQEVYLYGGTVQAGGTLIVTAKNIRMGGGFKVEKGATLKINYK